VKFWITKNSEVTVHEQIVTQVRVGIAAGDLRPGDRMPSAREVARRFGIHANTVTAAYRELAAAGDLELRRGSGTFVADAANAPYGKNSSLEAAVAELGAMLVRSGHSPADVAKAFGRWAATSAGVIYLLEPNDGLYRVLEFELGDSLGCRVERTELNEFSKRLGEGNIVVASPDEFEKLDGDEVADARAVRLRANSITQALSGERRPASDELIGVVSFWYDFAAFARVYLAAAGIDIETLVIRSASDANWASSLAACSVVICDAAAGAILGNDGRKRVFRLISGESLDELRGFLRASGPDDQALSGRE